jgi:ABC-type polysaccharide transport system permease subunit
MGDIFKEQLVKRTPSAQNRMLRYLLIAAAGVIAFFAVSYVPAFGIIIAFAVCFGAYYALSFFNVEYEYVFTSWTSTPFTTGPAANVCFPAM